MDFSSAVQAITDLLRRTRSDTFCSSWIRSHAPQVHRFILINVRTEFGGVDGDAVTRALDRKMQRRWHASRRGRPAKCVRDSRTVEIVLRTHRDKLSTSLASASANDEHVRDVISVALARIAQRGNVAAKEGIVKLVRSTIDEWIEQGPELYRWAGQDDLLRERIESCIRCYRYSGTLIGYLFKTLESRSERIPRSLLRGVSICREGTAADGDMLSR